MPVNRLPVQFVEEFHYLLFSFVCVGVSCTDIIIVIVQWNMS